MDELIRSTLNATAENTEMSKDHKTDLLISVLTEFLRNQLPDVDNN